MNLYIILTMFIHWCHKPNFYEASLWTGLFLKIQSLDLLGLNLHITYEHDQKQHCVLEQWQAVSASSKHSASKQFSFKEVCWPQLALVRISYSYYHYTSSEITLLHFYIDVSRLGTPHTWIELNAVRKSCCTESWFGATLHRKGNHLHSYLECANPARSWSKNTGCPRWDRWTCKLKIPILWLSSSMINCREPLRIITLLCKLWQGAAGLLLILPEEHNQSKSPHLGAL